MARCLLFAYGLLKPRYRLLASMTRSWPGEVRGRLFDLGPYPAAVEIGEENGTFLGEVLDIDESELPALDAYEGVDVGEYRRMETMTLAGERVWIYEYLQPIDHARPRIRQWESGGQSMPH